MTDGQSLKEKAYRALLAAGCDLITKITNSDLLERDYGPMSLRMRLAGLNPNDDTHWGLVLKTALEYEYDPVRSSKWLPRLYNQLNDKPTIQEKSRALAITLDKSLLEKIVYSSLNKQDIKVLGLRMRVLGLFYENVDDWHSVFDSAYELYKKLQIPIPGVSKNE